MIRKWVKRLAIILGVLVLVDILVWQIYDRVSLPEAAARLTRRAMQTDTDWTISFLQQPDGDADAQRLIYVHGTPGDATSLQRYLVDPLEGFESISIDRPGFGHTVPRKPALTLEEQARVIEPFLQERDGKWPILIGHSMGGPIIAQVAGMFPEKVGGLVIIAGALDPALEEWKWYNSLVNTWVTAYMIPLGLRNSNRELEPLKGELEKLKGLMADVRCPVVIVHAPDDMLVPYGNVAYMEAQFSEGVVQEVMVLEGRNHFLPWNSEGDIREAIGVVSGRVDGDESGTSRVVLSVESEAR